MAQSAVQRGLSAKEYLERERSEAVRHEYADGEIFALAGGTLEHSAIAAALIRDLGATLSGGRCLALTSDMRIKIPASDRYVYPDGSVVCGPPELEDDHRDTLLNPRLIIEVLSESTEAYDRGDKFAQYRTLPSLEIYLLASQKEPRIEVFEKQPDGSWLLRIYGPGSTVDLKALQCTLDVDRIYAGVLTDNPAAESV